MQFRQERTVRRRLIFGAIISLLLAATLFGLSFVFGPTTVPGKFEATGARIVPVGTQTFPVPKGTIGYVPLHGDVAMSFRFQVRAPAGKSNLFATSGATALVQPGQRGDWTMDLQLRGVPAYIFPIVPLVHVDRWYEVTLQLENQDHISAAVNGRQQFELTLPATSLNISLGGAVLGSPRTGGGGGVALQNFKVTERRSTLTSPIAQTVLRLAAGLLLAATIVLLLLFFITGDRIRRLIGLASASEHDGQSTPRWLAWLRIQPRRILLLGVTALAVGVTLMIVVTPPENNVLDQTGTFHLSLPDTAPNSQNTVSLGSLAAVGRSTATMDVTLSFQMRVGSRHEANSTPVVTTQDDKHDNGIDFYLDAKRRLWTSLTYGPVEGPMAYQVSKPLPVGQWTSAKIELTRGQKVVLFINGATSGYQEFSTPGWQGAAQFLSAGSNSTQSQSYVAIRSVSLVEKLYSAPVPRTKVFFTRSLQVLGFLLIVAGMVLAASCVFTTLFPRLTSTRRPLILVVFGVAAFGILVNLFIDILHLQNSSIPYITRNTWIFSHDDSFTDFLNPLEVFRARDAYNMLGASYPPIAYWLVSPFYWTPPFSALFIYMAAFFGYFLWWLRRSVLLSLRRPEVVLVTLVALTSFPFTYALSRGNIDISVFVLFTILVACLEQERLRAAASFVGLAIAAKVVPAMFLVVFLRRARWRFLWLALAVAASATVLGFLWFSGNLYSNVHEFANAFLTTQNGAGKGWNPIQISFGTNLSVWAQSIGYVINGIQGGSDVAQIAQYLELPIEVIGTLLVVFYVSFVDKELWRVVTLIVTAILLLPTPSGDYELLYVFVPIALFLRYADSSQRHLLIAVLFGLLLAPRVYFFVGDFFVGTDTLLTAPILILLAVLVVRDGLAERTLRRQMLPTGAVAVA